MSERDNPHIDKPENFYPERIEVSKSMSPEVWEETKRLIKLSSGEDKRVREVLERDRQLGNALKNCLKIDAEVRHG